MPFEYLDDEAIADIAFICKGSDLTALFSDAAKAVFNLQTDISTLTPDIKVNIDLKHEEVDRLLYKLLEEIIYLKDAELFFPKSISINVIKEKEGFSVKGEFVGCEFNFEIHPMGNDIKAITYHDFYVKETSEGWEAYVLIDI